MHVLQMSSAPLQRWCWVEFPSGFPLVLKQRGCVTSGWAGEEEDLGWLE